MMNLKNFIEETVKNIIEANENLETELNREIYISNDTKNRIDFDIAITYEEKKEKGAKVIKVLDAGINKENFSNFTNKIRFSIYVSSENKDEIKKRREKNQQFKN